MKFTKEKIKNAVVIIAVGVLLFTPVGFHFKVFVNRIISFSPDVLEASNQTKLSSYNWHLSSDNKRSDIHNFKVHEGKVVLINFWATWCPPCVAEMPSFQALYNDYKDDVIFVFVANDEKKNVDTYLVKKDYSLPVFYEKSKRPIELTSGSIPTTYILDKSGAIVVKEKGAADWNSDMIRQLLDTLIAEK
ncbi:TlpA family protein disulfide reductase [Cellulophaga sp. HaHaR_3_176]|uniref:TlpA family protein disulfide reductase n=1 Tax=Cellulophaga sp. HaHaR_3_176 TaxID=1942464 RepID=UPI001C1F3E46|nr:TlpA disulfide reductase family protein [Cellulophaga sp. HaHaR_3_176]QWX84484.1 TlpA family protein disulfide reductase [Cellulophaga sp. HaHaR_3_176]